MVPQPIKVTEQARTAADRRRWEGRDIGRVYGMDAGFVNLRLIVKAP